MNGSDAPIEAPDPTADAYLDEDVRAFQQTIRNSLPEHLNVELGDAILFALYGVQIVSETNETVSTKDYDRAVAPYSILNGVRDEDHCQAIHALLQKMNIAARNAQIQLSGRQFLIDQRKPSPYREPIPASYFVQLRDFDYELSRVTPSDSLIESNFVIDPTDDPGRPGWSEGNTYEWREVLIARLTFLEWLAVKYPCTVRPAKVPRAPKTRVSNGRDYRNADRPWLIRMHDFIESGEATGPEAAARRVFNIEIEGKSVESKNTKPDSRIKRLSKNYRKWREEEGRQMK